MKKMSKTPTRRRTQQERSTETRRRLVEATLDCIAEIGYRQTSSAEIVRRAGVSRGAQVHHFPTKLDLVAAAVEYMYDQDLSDSLKTVDRIRNSDHPAEDLVQVLWEEKFHGRLWEVTLEMIVAARSDTELRDRIKPLYESDHRRGDGLALVHMQQAADSLGGLAALLNFNFCVLRGLAFQRIFQDAPAYQSEILDLLKAFSAQCIRLKNDAA